MDESASRSQQDVSASDAIALTRQALRDTCEHLRMSDELLSRSRALRSSFDEPAQEDKVVRHE